METGIKEFEKPESILDVTPKTQDEKTEPCLYCGCLRKHNVEFYDDDYCSGKCRKADGGEIVLDVLLDDITESGLKLMEIGKLGETLRIKSTQLAELNVRLEQLQEERGNLLAKGLGTEQNRLDYDEAYATKQALESDIELIENNTIPKKHRELDAVKQVETAGVREALLDEKQEYIAAIQEAFEAINIAVASWRESRRKTGVSLNRKQEDLFGQIIIFDDTRKGLHPRIAGKRKAKLSVYPED